jgi:aldehyde dehydrogenase (NAD(P)+)
VTAPEALPTRDQQRVDLLVEHLEYGTVAVNTWSALAYTFASVPWGGFPGATIADPRSGIGWVHDPLLLPLVHNSIVRAPLLVRPTPPWFPWHPHAARLAEGVVDIYAALARGGSGLWPLIKMLPAVLAG